VESGHFKALSDMLPYQAPARHSNCVKSVPVYLKKICIVYDDHSNIQEYFYASFTVFVSLDYYSLMNIDNSVVAVLL